MGHKGAALTVNRLQSLSSQPGHKFPVGIHATQPAVETDVAALCHEAVVAGDGPAGVGLVGHLGTETVVDADVAGEVVRLEDGLS